MNTERMIGIIRGSSYEKWVGCAGYDTRPFTNDDYEETSASLPVAYATGFADGRESYYTEEGNLLEFLNDSPIGTVIYIPEFLGSKWLWDWSYIKGPDSEWHDITPTDEEDED